MSLEYRGNRRYYYRGRRINGRFTKQYVGSGAEAEAEASRAAAERNLRAELNQLEVMFAVIDICIEVLMEATMTAAGYHRHDRGPWRKKRGNKMNSSENQEPTLLPAPTDDERQEIQKAVKRAREGDHTVVPMIRAFIQTRPGASMALGGDLSWEALALQVRKHARSDLAVREAVFGRLHELRAELSGDNPNPRGIERLLIERVLSTWLHLYDLETNYANQQDLTLGKDQLFQRSLCAAQQRYLATLKELARIRKRDVPPLQINVAREQVNVAGNVTNAPPG